MQRFSLTLFGLINFLILVRRLEPSQMGTWALFLIVTTIFEVSKTNLLKNAHIRFASATRDRNEKSAIASSSLVINMMITAAFILLLLFFAYPLSHFLNAGKDLAQMLQWFIPGLICMIFFSHFEAVQQSNLDFKGGFAGYFVRQALFFLVIVLHFVFKEPISLPYLALYQSGSIFMGTLVLFIYSRKYLLLKFNPSRTWNKKILGYGGYIFGGGLMSNIFANIDQVMIAAVMKQDATAMVAHYNAASRVNQLIDIPSFAASEVLFPKVSQAAELEGNGRVKYLYERMVAVLLSFTIPATLFILIFPTFVISLIAGATYADAALILQLYMITGLVRPMQNQAANVINSMGKPDLVFWINTVFMVINLAVNYICLVSFGFYGAAIGTMITSIVGCFTWYVIMKRQVSFELQNIFRYTIDTYKILFSYAASLLSKARQVHA